jgi:peptide chain release factor 2
MTPLLREKSRLESELASFGALESARADMHTWLELGEEALAQGSTQESEEACVVLESLTRQLGELLERMEMSLLLGQEEDCQDAIVDVHSGAGGTDAQDWAEMLVRMYMRWADAHGMKAETLDYQPGEEAGIKGVTLRIAGNNAYGLLKGEKGIHRIIRISPFDSSGRRHTAFASVDVMPDAGQDIVINMKEADLRIDVFRAGGAGGQHVNKTESAVRITHLPTGLVAQCQNEKSQHSNRESAMRILRARLYNLELSRRDAVRQAEYAGKDAIAFGSQIRTYTMQPYRLVKDHRTNSEVGDVDSVLDGNLDKLLRDYLLWRHEQRTQTS